MKTKLLLLSSAFLLICGKKALSQVQNRAMRNTDYVITVANDTVKCKIRSTFLNKLEYKPNNGDQFIYIKSDNISQYFISDYQSTYILKQLPSGSYEYLKWTERGRIDLFTRFVIAGQNTVEYFYASKGNAPLVLIKAPGPAFLHADKVSSHDEQIQAFLNLFSDHLTFQEKFKNAIKGNFDYGTIQDCIQTYNRELATYDPNSPDYLITQKGDTIKCKLNRNIDGGYFSYKKNETDEYAKINNSSVKEFFYARENAHFILEELPIPQTKEFAERLIKGPINLYELVTRTKDGNKETVRYNWYVSKETQPLSPIKVDAKLDDDIRSHKELLKNFTAAIADNKDLLKQFKAKITDSYDNGYAISDEDLLRYIRTYNSYQEKNIAK